MISERAKEGFSYLIQEALKNSLMASSDGICVIETVEDESQIKEKEIVVLTISSYLFRIITLFYFTLNEETKDHFAKVIRVPVADMDDSSFYDAIGEFGNMFSGALNRYVGKYFQYVGLSTPNILEKNCASYLSSLDYEYIKHFKIKLNNSITFHSSLCICDYADLDFEVENSTEDETAGEMELF